MFQKVTLQELSEPIAQGISHATLLGAPEWLSIWESIGAVPLFFQSAQERRPVEKVTFSALRLGGAPLARIQAHLDGLPALALSSKLEPHDTNAEHFSDEIRDGVLGALRSVSGLYAHWVDYFNQFSGEEAPDGWTVQHIQTKRIALAGGFPKLPESVRRHIESGQRRGAVVRRAQSKEDVRATFDLTLRTHQRYARSRTYPLALYENLMGLAQNDRRVMWYVCEHDGDIIGAHIALHERDTVISWAPYMERSAREFKPAYVLLAKVIRAACERGAAYVNLGVTPSGASGVEQFKSRFGAETYTYKVFVYRSLIARVLGKGALV